MNPQTFVLTDFDEYVRKNPVMDYNHIRIVETVNYTIKCNTLGEQKEVHTEPW